MHFSRELLKRMEIKGIHDEYITVHLGLGSFRNIDVEDLTKHRMDSEQIFIPADVTERVNQRRDQGHKVCAIGVSTLRAMESSVSMNGHIKPFDGWTNKFIFPPYDFTTANALVTNFHLPYSVMLMLTCAFGGYETVMQAYKVAIDEKYRFGAYGDAMLINSEGTRNHRIRDKQATTRLLVPFSLIHPRHSVIVLNKRKNKTCCQ